MEYEGYELEAAEGTFELLVREALHPGTAVLRRGELRGHHARPAPALRTPPRPSRCARRTACTPPPPPATARSTRCDLCLRKCLSKLYPQITNVRLTDYKVRVLDSKKGTAANVRVLIEWSDHRKSWSTVGRLRQRDRGELARPGGRHPPGADAPDRARRAPSRRPSKTTAGASSLHQRSSPHHGLDCRSVQQRVVDQARLRRPASARLRAQRLRQER